MFWQNAAETWVDISSNVADKVKLEYLYFFKRILCKKKKKIIHFHSSDGDLGNLKLGKNFIFIDSKLDCIKKF